MPQPSSTPSIIIPLVYVILELRPTKNKQRFHLKASEFSGCSVEGSQEEGTGLIVDSCPPFETVIKDRDLSPPKEIYCVFISSLLFVFISY